MEIYELVTADNITLENATVKATYTDKQDAMQALRTEILLGQSQYNMPINTPCRFIELQGKVAVDFGSWSDFIGLTGVSLADFGYAHDNY